MTRHHSERIAAPDADLCLWRVAFDAPAAARCFAELRSGIGWRSERIVIFGRPQLVPRLLAWHGDPGAAYRYSGLRHDPEPWTPALQAIREHVESLCGTRFNSVLLNLYRDGSDGMGWHADDEPELGPEPAIASVSLGAVRRLRLRHRRRRELQLDLELPDGSLLLMAGPTQQHWLHSVPKTARSVGERINLTFRTIIAPPAQAL